MRGNPLSTTNKNKHYFSKYREGNAIYLLIILDYILEYITLLIYRFSLNDSC